MQQTFDEMPRAGVPDAIVMGVFPGSLFSVAMLVPALVLDVALGGQGLRPGFVASVVMGGLAGGILQQLCFNLRSSLRRTYPMRLATFGASYLLVLVACAWVGEWLPVGLPQAWVGFVVLYLALFAVITALVSRSLSRRGVEYRAALDEYHVRRGDGRPAR